MAESKIALHIGDRVEFPWGSAVVVGLTRGGEVILRDSTGWVATVPADQVPAPATEHQP